MNNKTALLRIVERYIDTGFQARPAGILHHLRHVARDGQFLKSLLLLSVLLKLSLSGFSQQSLKKDTEAVLEKVNQFFEALEKQDTSLFKNIILPGGQTWAVKEQGDSVRISMRSFEDRLKKFINPDQVIQERALDVEIKIHQQVAMAWVPYELDVSGRFEHCGVDIFTLVKNKEGWKIVTLAFTMEPDGCDAIKKTISNRQ